MTLTELIQQIKELETDYLYAGQEFKNANQYTIPSERAAQNRRKKKDVRDRLTREEKMVSTSNGLLCSYILGKLNLVKE